MVVLAASLVAALVLLGEGCAGECGGESGGKAVGVLEMAADEGTEEDAWRRVWERLWKVDWPSWDGMDRARVARWAWMDRHISSLERS